MSMREQTLAEKDEYKKLAEELRAAHKDATQASEVGL